MRYYVASDTSFAHFRKQALANPLTSGRLCAPCAKEMDRLSLKWLLERKSSAAGAAETADGTQQGDSVATVR